MTASPLEIVSASLGRGAALLLVLSRKRPGAAAQWTKVTVRPVEVQRQPMYQFSLQQADRVVHENLSRTAAGRRACALLEEVFLDGALYTATADYAIRGSRDGNWQCTTRPPSRETAPVAAASHNRSKSHLIPEGVPCPFLCEIGVMTPDGRVRNSMTRKFRQINRFLELVEDIVPALEVEPGRELRVVDFGCGKSYLTFALHHLLTEIHGRPAQILGLDRKADVMAHCAEIAGRLQCRGLEFRQGDIAAHREPGPVDLAVSLHACDTATDAALAQAVRWQARVILAVPCCQHELSKQIASPDLAPLLRHGILREQFATLATDGLRALALEACGYATQVVEFIDLEHTAKNLLLRAVRRPRADLPLQQVRRDEYRALQRVLGLTGCATDQVLPGEVDSS